MNRILFATSEAHPLIKTGGLADVSASLPAALRALGHDVRLIMPAYQDVLAKLTDLQTLARLAIVGETGPVELLEGTMPESGVPLYLIAVPGRFDRPGPPYTGPDGHDWPDNAARFAAFARAVVEVACDRAGLDWRPDIVHGNDWQCGLIPALLSKSVERPGTVFTIHNLAYQGLFDRFAFAALHLDPSWWSYEALEFHGFLSFIKGGLAFADELTTVSPTYAEEIKSAEFGYGLEGLLSYRAAHLHGILNGVDYTVWDPACDRLITQTYTAKSLQRKGANKAALQRRLALPEQALTPLIGMVGRLVEQKGIDLLLEALPELMNRPLQLAVVGSGLAHFEQALLEAARTYPERIGVYIGYDEALAHQVEAGADLFLMPSRFEPCGLNQIYSLRYGTPPIVRRTGGLADTVVHADEAARRDERATGFVFEEASAQGLLGAVEAALKLYPRPRLWRRLVQSAMARDFSWEDSARHYLELYARIKPRA